MKLSSAGGTGAMRPIINALNGASSNAGMKDADSLRRAAQDLAVETAIAARASASERKDAFETSLEPAMKALAAAFEDAAGGGGGGGGSGAGGALRWDGATWCALVEASGRLLHYYRHSLVESERTRLRRTFGQFCVKVSVRCIGILENDGGDNQQWARCATPALKLLIEALKTAPQSLRTKLESIEASLGRIVCRPSSPTPCECELRGLAAAALAGTVACAQDEAAAWSGMMRRTVLQMHDMLDGNDPSRPGGNRVSKKMGTAARNALIPAGAEPPPALLPDSRSDTGATPLGRVAVFSSCAMVVEALLSIRRKDAVPLSVSALLMLVHRTIVAEAGGAGSWRPGHEAKTSVMMQIASLSVLKQILLACGYAPLLPRATEIVDIIERSFPLSEADVGDDAGYLDLLTSHRMLVYSLCTSFLDSFKGGGALHLANTLVRSAVRDLTALTNVIRLTSAEESAETVAMQEALEEAARGKKKRRVKSGQLADGDAHTTHSWCGALDMDAHARVGMKAIESLEAMLDAGGELLPPEFRTRIDTCIHGTERALASSLQRHSPLANASRQALMMSVLVPSAARPGRVPSALQALSVIRSSRTSSRGEGISRFALALAVEASLHPPQMALLPAYTESKHNPDYFADNLRTAPARAVKVTIGKKTGAPVRPVAAAELARDREDANRSRSKRQKSHDDAPEAIGAGSMSVPPPAAVLPSQEPSPRSPQTIVPRGGSPPIGRVVAAEGKSREDSPAVTAQRSPPAAAKVKQTVDPAPEAKGLAEAVAPRGDRELGIANAGLRCGGFDSMATEQRLDEDEQCLSSDSDGPLPEIVDGDPSSDSDGGD